MITKEQKILLNENKDLYAFRNILNQLDMSVSMGFINEKQKEELIEFYNQK